MGMKMITRLFTLYLFLFEAVFVLGFQLSIIFSRKSSHLFSQSYRSAPLSNNSSAGSPLFSSTKRGIPTTEKQKCFSKAPLVDSTLLRFLAAQKSQIRVQKPSKFIERKKDVPTSIDTRDELGNDVLALATFNSDDSLVDVDTNINNASSMNLSKRNNRILAESLWPSSPSTYCSIQRIGQILIEMDVKESEAIEAEISIQNYAFARSAKQRVRKFLRDRDALWAMDKLSIDKNNYFNQIDELMQLGDNSNVENVIDLLVCAGLKGKDIAAVFTHTPGLAMMTTLQATLPSGHTENDKSTVRIRTEDGEVLDDILSQTYFGLLCQTLNLRKYDARKVLRMSPGLLTKKGKSALEVITILSSLGVEPTSLVRFKASIPALLSRPPASLFRLVGFLSGGEIRMDVSKIGPLIRGHDCSELLNAVAPVPKRKSSLSAFNLNLNTETDFGMKCAQDMFKPINEVSQETILKRYQKMSLTAKVIKHQLNIQDLEKVVLAYPSILLLDLETQIAPVVDFLCDEIGIDDEDVPRLVEAFPSVLGTSVTNMEEVFEYLTELEVSEDVMPSIFFAFPSLLTLDVKTKMVPVVDFLQNIGVSNIGRFITRLPTVLTNSVEKDLVPKWNFLSKVYQYASFEVIRFPAYFSYPLERVIKTRYEYLRNVKCAPVQLFAVDDVLRYGDKDFAIKVAKDIDNGKGYAYFISEKKGKINV